MNEPVVKNALVCNTSDLPLIYLRAEGPIIVSPIPDAFWLTPSKLADRAVCETDETTQQFLPYITVYDRDEKLVFVYSRGKGGAEARLVGNLSVGLGGHVDEEIPEGYDLMGWLANEGQRELREEAGLDVEGGLTFTGLIRDTSNPVGRVHLGVWSAVAVSSDAIQETEADIVENGEWLSIDELLNPIVYDRLENWSKAVVIYLMDNGFPSSDTE